MALLSPKFNFLIPVVAYGLTVLCPTVPTSIWIAIIGAINNGDVDLAAIQAFCVLHGIKADYRPEDFPYSPPIPTPNNLNK